MKYLKSIDKFKKFINKPKEKTIDDICKEYNIENYHINPDGTIDVYRNVYLINKGLKEIPLKFGNVSGGFYCDQNNLTNLIGSPRRINDTFDCSENVYLTSLEGCPEYIGGDFYCSNNTNLWSMDYFPRHANWVNLDNTPIEPIFDLFRSEYLADGGEFFTTSGTMMDFFWDMDPVYPGGVVIKWRLEKFLKGLNKELSSDDIKNIKKWGWKIK